MNHPEWREALARAKFQLYMRYGIGIFNNWLDMSQNRIERQEVLDSLAYESIRELAVDRLAHLQNKATELEGLLAESAQTQDSP